MPVVDAEECNAIGTRRGSARDGSGLELFVFLDGGEVELGKGGDGVEWVGSSNLGCTVTPGLCRTH